VDLATHWDNIYASKAPEAVSWFEADPVTSLSFLERALEEGARSVIDVGGGASMLVDRLLDLRVERIAVLDHSGFALRVARERLGDRAANVRWIIGSVTEEDDVGSFDVWHDRAVFHFLTDADDRRHYVELLGRTVPPGGWAVIATFALDGPERCGGLDVRRYDAQLLSSEVGDGWSLADEQAVTHVTPSHVEQRFVYGMFRRNERTEPTLP